MSPGSRSGVNWMRVLVPCTDCASARASEVLPVPGHVLEQHVAVAQHRGEDEFDDVALSEDGPLHVVGDLAERLREPGRLLLRDGHGRCPSVVADVVADVVRAGQGAGAPAGRGRTGRFGSHVAVKRRVRGRQPPALRRPVHRHRDALDAHRADRHGPVSAVCASSAPGRVVVAQPGVAERDRRLAAGRCRWTSRPAGPGRPAHAGLHPPARLHLVRRASRARGDARPRRRVPPQLVDVAHLDRGVAVEHGRARPPAARIRRGSGSGPARRARILPDDPLGARARDVGRGIHGERPSLRRPAGLLRAHRLGAVPAERCAVVPGLDARGEAVLLAVREPGEGRLGACRGWSCRRSPRARCRSAASTRPRRDARWRGR